VNVRLGAFYLGKLCTRYGGDLPRAIAGYNAGEEAVDRWLGDMPPAILADADGFVEEIPFQETRDYVKKVWRSYNVYRRLYPQ
jgi:soluble lytic murein transglycosylase